MEAFLIMGGIFLFGLIFFIIGLVSTLKYFRLSRMGCKVPSSIYNITSSTDDEGHTYYSAHVSYMFNGVLHKKSLAYYKRGMRIGDTIWLYCNPYKPTEVTSIKFNKGMLVFLIVGGIICSVDMFVGLLMFLFG